MIAPAWVTVFSALLTPTIAIAVGWIAYQQWRTSRAKLNLDVFEKRSQVYEEAFEALRTIMTHASAQKDAPVEKMIRAWRASQFLFGDEVSIHLDALLRKIVNLAATEDEMNAMGQNHQAYVQKKWEIVREIAKEKDELINWFRPYMLIDDKRVRPFSETFKDLNRRRLSYADEKQQ